jgi:D-alanine--poly(phosphoribitol) ligase subunit 1
MKPHLNLAEGIRRLGQAAPHSLALSVDGRAVSYGDLAALGRRIAHWLAGRGAAGRVGVLGGRSLGAYAGVVGTFWAGATYVPLGLRWPEERLRVTLAMTRLDALIVDAEGARALSPQLLRECPASILLAEPASGAFGARFSTLDALDDQPDLLPAPRPASHVAYIIFTSGTTGAPKGVQVGLGAIHHHMAVVQEVYRVRPADRVSLAFDLTFDPSIFNMLMAWSAGASLHVVPQASLIAPVDFIRDHRLTVWNATPATIGLLMRLGSLEPGTLPDLRLSIFGGDTLTLEAAMAWQRAAPLSCIDNVYGPTEATIECLHQPLTDPPVVTAARGSLAIGEPYAGTEAAIFDADRNPLPPGEPGELGICGPQLALGYLDQPELTAARFPILNGRRWYLTGDLAYRDGAGRFHHLGRCDEQIKVRGHRVELGEVESHLRQVCGTASAVAVGWPVMLGAATGLVGFFAAPPEPSPASPQAMRAALASRLPSYMVPQSIRRIDSLPLTPHGKVDRAALRAMLDGERRA